MRDETVLFADFSLAEGTVAVVPAAPDNLAAITQTGGRIILTWKDNSQNEDQFRIDRSGDRLTWSYLATAKASATSFLDSAVVSAKQYYYRIRAENAFGNSGYSNVASAMTEGTTGVQTKENVPASFALESFPNPFNPTTELQYSLPCEEHVMLVIYDVNGHEVETLIDQPQEAGIHRCTWDGSSARGGRVASGAYLARLTAGGWTKTVKLVLVK
jgi:hypothetical protein